MASAKSKNSSLQQKGDQATKGVGVRGGDILFCLLVSQGNKKQDCGLKGRGGGVGGLLGQSLLGVTEEELGPWGSPGGPTDPHRALNLRRSQPTERCNYWHQFCQQCKVGVGKPGHS